MPDLLKDFDTSGAPRIKLALGIVSRVVGDSVYAILPSFNQHHEFGPMKAQAAVGTKILVAFDEQGTPWAVTGVTTPTGAAGGDLTGTYPNPTIKNSVSLGGDVTAGSLGLIGQGTAVIFSGAPNMDIYANIRVVRSVATGADGMYIGYGGTGGPIRLFGEASGVSPLTAHVEVGIAGSLTWSTSIGSGDTTLSRRSAGVLQIGSNAVVVDNDARLTDARTPIAHRDSHMPGGPDVVLAMGISDSRATEETPYQVATHQRALRGDFKQRGSITGAPGAGTYGTLITYAKWSDDSGGGSTQVWYDDSNPPRVFVRRGTVAGGWGAWSEIAQLASPAFTGTPTAPTPSAGDNTTKLATTAFVQAAHPKVTRGTTPPGSPADGDIWICTAASGVYWQFVYDSSETTHKWKYVGGAPLAITDFSDASTTQVLTGMNITVPRAGVYDLSGFTQAQATPNAGTWFAWYVDYTVNGAAVGEEVRYTASAPGGQLDSVPLALGIYRRTLAASDVVSLYITASNWDFVSPWRSLSVTPVKVI